MVTQMDAGVHRDVVEAWSLAARECECAYLETSSACRLRSSSLNLPGQTEHVVNTHTLLPFPFPSFRFRLPYQRNQNQSY